MVGQHRLNWCLFLSSKPLKTLKGLAPGFKKGGVEIDVSLTTLYPNAVAMMLVCYKTLVHKGCPIQCPQGLNGVKWQCIPHFQPDLKVCTALPQPCAPKSKCLLIGHCSLSIVPNPILELLIECCTRPKQCYNFYCSCAILECPISEIQF